jgi:Uma2 family endonuclease
MEPLPLAHELPARPITVRLWHAMIEAGVLDADDKVELIEGVIVAMSPQGPLHRRLVVRLNNRLSRALPPEWVVSCQCPITLGGHSEPEPDLAVVSEAEAASETEHPSHPALCVEVSHTSLQVDRLKVGVYATYGVPEVWIVDVGARAIEVYRGPDVAASRYGSLQTLSAGHLSPVRFPEVVIDVLALFA